MLFKQYYLGCLAHASYLIADERTRVAAIVDPQRDVEQYLKDAAEMGLTIRYVFLTHFHADFVAGHVELRNRTGAEIYLGARADAEYAFTAVKDGDVVEFGEVRLKVLETPGHTPEGISLLVYDLQRSDRDPQSVLTGDTLFIGDVGRPDLMASIGVSATELAGQLYDSLHEKLLWLPESTKVYPAHGAGSMCGKNLSNETVSTIGQQRRYNYACQPMTKDEFIRLVTADQPDAPDYFAYDAQMNRQERVTLDENLGRALQPMDLEAVLRMQAEGAQIVDVRSAIDFEGAHLRGSLNIGLAGKYATWCGTVLNRTRPIVLIAETGQESEAAMRLGRIGFDHVQGYLDGGLQTLQDRPELIQSTPRISAVELAEQLDGPQPPKVLDVRTSNERGTGAIDGSLHIPLQQLEARLNELHRDAPLVVHCAGGYRSAIATSILERAGFANVADLIGGYAAWEKAAATVTT